MRICELLPSFGSSLRMSLSRVCRQFMRMGASRLEHTPARRWATAAGSHLDLDQSSESCVRDYTLELECADGTCAGHAGPTVAWWRALEDLPRTARDACRALLPRSAPPPCHLRAAAPKTKPLEAVK